MRKLFIFIITLEAVLSEEWSGDSQSKGIAHNVSDYNKFVHPTVENVSFVTVNVFLHFESIREISSECTLDFYLLQFWTDSRLSTYKAKVTGRYLPDNIWYPDTYFLLVRGLEYSNEEQYIVFNRSLIEYNRKTKLKTPCSPNVQLFPFDVTKCTLVVTSFSYSELELVYKWMNTHGEEVFVDRKNNRAEQMGFFFEKYDATVHQLTYADKNYSSLKVELYLRRKYSTYLFQVYIPSGLIVMLSWTVFWINQKATPARASLGVTTVLTMLTLSTQSQYQNAKHVNNNMTALDLYLWVSFVFVIMAMLEFALSDFQVNSTPVSEKLVDTDPQIVSPEDVICRQDYPHSFQNMDALRNGSMKDTYVTTKHFEIHHDVINKWARIVFPVFYVIFNILYWGILFALQR